jgi:putative ABC transport system permease protein
MRWIRDFGTDLAAAARTLRRQPGFTALAAAVLALGLGGTITMFSLLDALLLRPLPFPESDRLVRIHRTVAVDRSDDLDRQHSPGAFLSFRAERDVFQSVAAIAIGGQRIETTGGQPVELLLGSYVSSDYFTTFQVQPRRGRLFAPDEYERGRDNVVLLSSQLWHSHFGSDPGIVGRTVRIEGAVLTVIGVMPPELHDPLRYWSRGLFWRPLVLPPGAGNNYRDTWLRLIARLAPGVSLATARAATKSIASRLDADHQTSSSAALVTPQSTGALDPGGLRMMWLSMGLAGLVLFLTCVNVAGVQLARLSSRRHDLAVRAALGASRGRLVRLLIAESLLLTAIGCLSGLIVAHVCTQVLASRITIGFRWVTVGVPAYLDGRAIAFAVGLALATALVVGTIPALLSAREAVGDSLRSGGRGTSGGWPWLRRIMVVFQMALALVLLAAGGLFLRGLHRFTDAGPGWATERLLTAQLDLQDPIYRGEPGAAFLEQLQQRLSALPGVEAAALAAALPVWEDTWRSREVWPMGSPRPRPGESPSAFGNAVTPDYFRALGLSLREGRLFHAADRKHPSVIIVNESMARGLWPGQSAVGKRLGHPLSDPAKEEQWATVVGVIADARFAATVTAPKTRYQLYHPLGRTVSPTVVVRTRSTPQALAADLRRVVKEMAPTATISEIEGAQAVVDRTLTNVALLAWTLFAFAGLGLVVSALGVYSLFAGYVVQRRREIGVRMALGAQTGQVLRLVLKQGLMLALAGGALGMAGAIAVARVLTSIAAELPAHESVAVPILAGALVAVAMFACWLPARRAARVDPMVALRAE